MTAGAFKALVESLPETARGCKLWPFARRNNYGAIVIDGRNHRAHRLSYVVFKGPIPEGFVILHQCDCPPCVNPDHLFAGTQIENMNDMAKKGRASKIRYRPKITPIRSLNRIDDDHLGPLTIKEGDTIINVSYNPHVGGWLATMGSLNIINPYTGRLFSKRESCVRVATYFVKRGFFPKLKKRTPALFLEKK